MAGNPSDGLFRCPNLGFAPPPKKSEKCRTNRLFGAGNHRNLFSDSPKRPHRIQLATGPKVFQYITITSLCNKYQSYILRKSLYLLCTLFQGYALVISKFQLFGKSICQHFQVSRFNCIIDITINRFIQATICYSYNVTLFIEQRASTITIVYMCRNLIMSRIILYASSGIDDTCSIFHFRTHNTHLWITEREDIRSYILCFESIAVR